MMESCSSDELSSDEEVSLHSVIQTGTEDIEVYLVLQLQSEFAKGRLKPGLLSRAAPPKTYTNNVVSKTREKFRRVTDTALKGTPVAKGLTFRAESNPPLSGNCRPLEQCLHCPYCTKPKTIVFLLDEPVRSAWTAGIAQEK